jgi:hypothetical protein
VVVVVVVVGLVVFHEVGDDDAFKTVSLRGMVMG